MVGGQGFAHTTTELQQPGGPTLRPGKFGSDGERCTLLQCLRMVYWIMSYALDSGAAAAAADDDDDNGDADRVNSCSAECFSLGR